MLAGLFKKIGKMSRLREKTSLELKKKLCSTVRKILTSVNKIINVR